MGSFTVGMDKYIKGRIEDLSVIPRKIALTVYRGVIMDTPVREGFARGSWQATLGSPATVDNKVADKSGRRAVGAAIQGAQDWKPIQGGSFYLTSLCPYMARLNGGSSKQAPAMFVERNVLRVGGVLDGGLQ